MRGNAKNQLTSLQSRLARTALRWTIVDLAQRSGVDKNTIADFEGDRRRTNPSIQAQLRRVFEEHGCQFLNGDGIRFKGRKTEGD